MQVSKEQLCKILGRDEMANVVNFKPNVKGKRILITGALGSIGDIISDMLVLWDAVVLATDKHNMDVTDPEQVAKQIHSFKPDIILHLAGAKHAPEGEINVVDTFDINTIGTLNVIANASGSKVVLTSTCKSCNPETVYGASKLIAERMVLNSGGCVARFYNVVETAGNVFEIWGDSKTIEVAGECERYFISISEAIGLILFAMEQDGGRYSINVPFIRKMSDIVKDAYSDRKIVPIKPRRGDRLKEKRMSTNEQLEKSYLGGNIVKIRSWNDKETNQEG